MAIWQFSLEIDMNTILSTIPTVVMYVDHYVMSSATDRSHCPRFFGEPINSLVNARLFDGPVSGKVKLAPDNEDGAAWDVRGYKSSGRELTLLCEFKDGTSKEVIVKNSPDRCHISGKHGISAWCGK